MTAASDDVALVRSFGDVLRQIPPDHFPVASEQVQGAVTAALQWFVIEATELAANHCVGISAPTVPSVMLWDNYDLPVDKAIRPTSFRPYVTRLRSMTELCERPTSAAFNDLPPDERLRVRGGPDRSQLELNGELLGLLLDDFVYARSWLATFGTKAGYWSYRWISHCLSLAAHRSDESRAELATTLRDSAEHHFHYALASEPS